MNGVEAADASALLALAAVATAASWTLTGTVRRAVTRRAVLDIPNERSLHSAPTPRGGGLAIAVVTLGGITLLTLLGGLSMRDGTGVVGGGLLVAGIGWADDMRPRSARIRAAVHAAAALWLLVWIGGLDSLRLGGEPLALGWWGNVLAGATIVWSINLYNFMDGIDGLAAGQAVVAAGVGAVLLGTGLAVACALVAGVSLGFLWWNWAPARIFMGDVGSGLLGFLFAALALLSDRDGGPDALTWLMLGGVFLVDATATLLRRMLRGERWYAAHRNHAYQRAVQSGWTHAQVATGALVLSGFGAGLAWVGVLRPGWQWPAFLLELVVLLGVYAGIERRVPMPRSPS